MERVLVLDIGGTSLKSGLFENGSLSDVRERPSRAAQGAEKLLETVFACIEEYKAADAVRIGLSTSGQVDSRVGTILYANQSFPGYTGTPVKALIEERFGLPVRMENDVNAAALGELYFGAGKELRDFICLTYGTGIGGALVLDGKLYRGSAFSAGEAGSMVIHPEDRDPDRDMYAGGYEKYASAAALVEAVQKIDPKIRNGREAFACLERPEIRQAVDRWISQVLLGLVGLIHLLDPEAVLLGGGVMEQSYVIEQIRGRLPREIMPSYRHVRIIPAALGNRAGLYGAAALWLYD